MKTSFGFGFILTALTVLTILACSKEDESGIKNLFIEAEKDLIVLGFDTIRLSSTARDADLKIVDGIAVSYTVNGMPFDGDAYVPTSVGRYDFVGMYQGVESNVETVEVTTIDEELDRFELLYEGNQYLTTNPWSISGQFIFNAVFRNLNIDIPFREVQFFIDGEEIDEDRFLHFEEAGTYRMTASFAGQESNPILLFVREEIQYEEITIPIIFHTYGLNTPNFEMERMLDSLNSAFSRTYSRAAVQAGLVNPNAVDCRMKFVMSEVDKFGNALSTAGINKITTTENRPDSVLFADDFPEFERLNNLDPNEAINIWVTNNVNFGFSPLNENEVGGSGNGRGLANTPVLATLELDGIPTLNSLFGSVDTTGVSHSIVVIAGSIFGTHPDFLVSRVAYHLGLFDTGAFLCGNQGDYCPDTYGPNFNAPPTNETDKLVNCNSLIYRPNNFMGFFSNKVCFTYDQRERMRFIMEHGLNRPGN